MLVLKTTASNLIEKHLAGCDKGLYPDEFEAILGKKLAFKIDISQFNVQNNFWFFGVSKFTDDEDIISELEKKANNIEGDRPASLINGFIDMDSQETVHLNDDNSAEVTMGVGVGTESNQTLKSKVVTESIDDNVITPLPNCSDDNCMESKYVGEPATFKRKSKQPDFKKNLVASYDFEENGELSTTKPVLLILKIEK